MLLPMDVDTCSSGTANELVAMAQTLAPREAIRALTEANRNVRRPELDIALATIRHWGFDLTAPEPVQVSDGPPTVFEMVDHLPTVQPANLTAQALSDALEQYGCLFVPGLLDQHQAGTLTEGIDRSFEAFDRYNERPLAPRPVQDRAWFEPFQPAERYAKRMMGGRSFTRSTGGLWTIESPHMLFELTELFESIGLKAAIAGHLGEQPALSAAKCNIRRTPVHLPGGWHQDGSFVGLDITSIDAWIALSDCGRDAPGLEVVPHRFDDLLPTGLDGVVIPHETVLERVKEIASTIVDREYRAGDALLFDHLFLHRTAIRPTMTKERYALETWFFGPSHYPASQVPLLY